MDRPQGVPTEAAFCRKHRSWESGKVEGDIHLGEFRAWSDKGPLRWTGAFDEEGRLHGKYQTFYSDGALEQDGQFDHGMRAGLWTWYEGKDADGDADYLAWLGAPPEIRHWTAQFADGKHPGLPGMRFFAADGAELDRWGRPIGSARPTSLPELELLERAGLTSKKLSEKMREAAGSRSPGHPAIARIVPRGRILGDLMAQGANPSEVGVAEKMPVHYAAEIASPEAIDVLIEARVAVNFRDRDGLSPLLLAARASAVDPAAQLRSIDLLLSAGASLEDRGNDGNSALDHACWNGRLDLVRALLDRKAPLPAQGRTPLHIAARTGNAELATMLLAAGVSREAVDADKKRPWDLAKADGHLDLLPLLQPTVVEPVKPKPKPKAKSKPKPKPKPKKKKKK